MSFDHNYPNRKDHRRPYRDSRRIDCTCRNHGSCPWCKRRRLFDQIKTEAAIEQDYLDFINSNDND
jgi:hypothetical protein